MTHSSIKQGKLQNVQLLKVKDEGGGGPGDPSSKIQFFVDFLIQHFNVSFTKIDSNKQPIIYQGILSSEGAGFVDYLHVQNIQMNSCIMPILTMYNLSRFDHVEVINNTIKLSEYMFVTDKVKMNNVTFKSNSYESSTGMISIVYTTTILSIKATEQSNPIEITNLQIIANTFDKLINPNSVLISIQGQTSDFLTDVGFSNSSVQTT